MRIIWILPILILFGFKPITHASEPSGTVVNNAGGGSELALVYSFQNYEALVRPCLNQELCHLNNEELALLEILVRNSPIEQKQAFRFLNFEDSKTAVYKTKSEIGSPIEWNKPLLWRVGQDGKLFSYSVAEAITVLTMAFSEHYPSLPSPTKVSLSQKLRKYGIGSQSLIIPFQTSENLRIQILKKEETDILLLEDGFDVFLNLQSIIEKETGCSLSKLAVFSLSWTNHFATDENPLRTILYGRLGWQCHGDSKRWKASLTIVSLVSPITGKMADYWKNPSATKLKLVNNKPEIILSQIE